MRRVGASKTNRDLAFLGELFDQGKVTPVVDNVFPLAKTADAFRHYESGNFVGKIVVFVG